MPLNCVKNSPAGADSKNLGNSCSCASTLESLCHISTRGARMYDEMISRRRGVCGQGRGFMEEMVGDASSDTTGLTAS